MLSNSGIAGWDRILCVGKKHVDALVAIVERGGQILCPRATTVHATPDHRLRFASLQCNEVNGTRRLHSPQPIKSEL
jgi:hypothetical protein